MNECLIEGKKTSSLSFLEGGGGGGGGERPLRPPLDPPLVMMLYTSKMLYVLQVNDIIRGPTYNPTVR